MRYKPIFLALLAVAVLSLGPAIAQATCDYTLNPPSVDAGTQIKVTAPADWQGRSLTYAWEVYNVTTGNPVDPLFGEDPLLDANTATYTFLAPDPGSYNITLTVNDKTYTTSCMDTRCMSFSTTSSFTCPMQSVTFCEVDWGTALPATITYEGALVPGRALQWLIGDKIVQEGLASDTGMAKLTPDWADTDGSGPDDTGIFDVSLGTPPVTPGGINVGEVHTITLKVYKPPFTFDDEDHYTGTLEDSCTATYTSVADPLAQITQPT